jgi:hypothetical protein
MRRSQSKSDSEKRSSSPVANNGQYLKSDESKGNKKITDNLPKVTIITSTPPPKPKIIQRKVKIDGIDSLRSFLALYSGDWRLTFDPVLKKDNLSQSGIGSKDKKYSVNGWLASGVIEIVSDMLHC